MFRGRCDLHRLAWGLVVVIGACSSSDVAQGECAPSPFRSTPPLVIAHAGGEGLGPANTMLAMHRSIDAGADIVDADLWMTADGIVVAAHNRDLAAATGHHALIDETSWTVLQQFDTRVGWSGQPIADPVPIPSLEQILIEFPNQLISLEIKQVEPSISDALCQVLTTTGSIGRVYLSSNHDAALYEARDHCPSVRITTTYADVAAMRAARESGAAWCAPADIGQPPYRAGRFDPASLDWSHDHGLAVFTWTVDDPETLMELAEAGVDGVYTRRPDVARSVFDEFAAGA